MKLSLRSKILQMEVGGTLIVRFADGKPSLVRNYASTLGAEYRRTYSVNYDRAKNRCLVTRTA